MDILPPAPPSKEEEFIPGNFDYVQSKCEKIMLTTAYKAITITETWDFFKNFEDNSDYSADEINKVYTKIEELNYLGHSGCSFICTINKMIFIAKYGELKYKEEYEKYKNYENI